MILYLVRHGKTSWNEKGLLQGQTDIELSEIGKKQAELIKNKIENKIDVCISSPLKRAIDTAKIVYDGKIIIDPRIIERRFGQLEGKPRSLYNTNAYWNYELNKSDMDVESIKDLFSRCSDFICDIKKQYKDSCVLVVTHGATLRALNFVIKGFTKDQNLLDFDVVNCAVFKYVL